MLSTCCTEHILTVLRGELRGELGSVGEVPPGGEYTL